MTSATQPRPPQGPSPFFVKSLLIVTGFLFTLYVLFGPASPTSTAGDDPAVPHGDRPGSVMVCLTTDVRPLSPQERVVLPKTTAFWDQGINMGKPQNPATWRYEIKEGGGFQHAAFELLEDVTLTQTARCGRARADMLTSSMWTRSTAESAEHHIFTITDVEDYPIPAEAPPIEIGQLIDDIGVQGVVVEDIDPNR